MRSCKIIGFSRISGHISHHASHQKGYRPNYRLWRAKQDETRMNGGRGEMGTNICQAIMCRTWINTNVRPFRRIALIAKAIRNIRANIAPLYQTSWNNSWCSKYVIDEFFYSSPVYFRPTFPRNESLEILSSEQFARKAKIARWFFIDLRILILWKYLGKIYSQWISTS